MHSDSSKILLFIFILTNSFFVKSQYYDWAKTANGTNKEEGKNVIIDTEGNIISIGVFTDTVDFDPGAGIFELYAGDRYDTFIQKLNPLGELIWVKSIENYREDEYSNSEYALDVDLDGNIYIGSNFSDSSNFDPEDVDGEHIMYTEDSSLNSFILKLDASGDFVWVNLLTGDISLLNDLDIDNEGYIYSTGRFSGTVDFDPGLGSYSISSIGSSNMFVLKLSVAGEFQWAKSVGSIDGVLGYGITHSNTDNILITGLFNDTLDFDPGPGVLNKIADNRDAFVLCLDSMGLFLWVKTFGGEGSEKGLDIATDSLENIYVHFWNPGSDEIFFDGDPDPVLSRPGFTGNAGIVMKLDSIGNFIWLKITPESSNVVLTSDMFVSASGIHICGLFTSSADFDPGPDDYDLVAAGFSQNFILKLDLDGNFMWVYVPGKIDGEYGFTKINAVAGDNNTNEVYAVGSYYGNVYFDPNDFDVTVPYATPYPDGDYMIFKLYECFITDTNLSIYGCGPTLSPSGEYTFYESGSYFDTLINANGCDSLLFIDFTLETSFDSTTIETCDNYTSPSGTYIFTESGTYSDTLTNLAGCDSVITIDLTIHHSDNDFIDSIIICDQFTVPSGDESYLIDGTYSDTISTIHGCDSILTFIVNIINSSVSSNVETVCSNFTSVTGNIYTESGIYHDTLINMEGCDSIIITDLTIVINSGISIIDGVLSSNTDLATYQWVDCESDYAVITGETDQTYIPASNGSYAVIVNKSGCIDTTDCISLVDVGLINYGDTFNIYPNPFSDFTTISFGKDLDFKNELLIQNILGQEIYRRENLIGSQLIISKEELGTGIYLLSLRNNGAVIFTAKLIVQ